MKKMVRAAILLLILVPPIVLAYLINIYGVNFPFWDQWEIATIFPKYHDGTLGIRDLFAQHNESRKVFPRLIFLFLGNLSGWNVRWEMAAMFVAACLTMASFARITFQTLARIDFVSALALLAASVLIFSPVQNENWLWGIQLVVFMPITCLALGLVVAYSSLAFPIRFGLCALLATVSTYSYANGMLCWPLLLPALLLAQSESRKPSRIFSIAWVTLAIAEIVLYFFDYHKPSDALPFNLSTQTLLHAFTFWGSPLARWSGSLLKTSEILGAVLCVISLAFAGYLCVYRQDVALRRRSLPWLTVMAYAIASGAITAAGRSASGAQQALVGRYTTFGIYLAVAVVMLAPIVLDDLRRRSAFNRIPTRPLAAIVSTLLISTQLFAFNNSLIEMGFSRVLRLQDEAAVQWIHFAQSDPGVFRTYPLADRLHDRATALDRIGLLNPPLVRPDSMSRVFVETVRPADYGGLLAPARLEDGGVLLRGWAVLPARREPSDAVVVTAYPPQPVAASRPAAPQFVAVSTLKTESADLAEVTGIPAYLAAGFEIAISPALQHGTTLRAWSYDAATGRAYPIEGSIVVP